MDATRISDGAYVMIKLIDTSSHPFEVEISQFFQSDELRSAPQNHCVPILDVLQSPSNENQALLIMPLLRKYDDPAFATVEEAVDFVGQILEV
jgi:hypothetical protein